MIVRFIICIVILLFIFAFVAPHSQALSYDELYEQVIDSFSDAVPESATESIKQDNITFDAVLDELKNGFNELFPSYTKLLGRMLAIVLLGAFAGVFLGISSSKDGVIGAISAICAFSALSPYLTAAVSQTADFAVSFGRLSSSFIPAFAGVAVTCGQGAAATVYSGLCLGASTILCSFLTEIIVPMASVLFAITVSAAFAGKEALNELVRGTTRFVKIMLTAAGVIFAVVCSLQTIVAGVTDAAAVSAGRFFSGTAVPIVGGRLAESMGTVFGSLKILKGTVGAGGIIAFAALCAGPLLRCVGLSLLLWVSGLAAKLLGEESISMMFAGIRETVEIIAAVICLCFSIMAFSGAVLIRTGVV